MHGITTILVENPSIKKEEKRIFVCSFSCERLRLPQR